MSDIKKGRRGILLLDGALLILALITGPLASAMIDYLPDCVFARLGITCPACGATRCVRELFSGNFDQALRLHPFLFCLCFYLAVAWGLLNVGYLIPQNRCQRVGRAMVSGKAVIALCVLYALFGIVRMLLTLPL